MKKQELIDLINNEEWKTVVGLCTDRFLVSNKGGIKNTNWHNTGKTVIMNPKPNNGYINIGFWYNRKFYHFKLHRAIYETFVGPIPKGYDVHHINHNPIDNRVENLELIKRSKHCKLHNIGKIEEMAKISGKKRSKPVIQYTLNGDFVAEYPSIIEASRQTGIANTHISNCCREKVTIHTDGHKYVSKTAGGCIWKYKEVAE